MASAKAMAPWTGRAERLEPNRAHDGVGTGRGQIKRALCGDAAALRARPAGETGLGDGQIAVRQLLGRGVQQGPFDQLARGRVADLRMAALRAPLTSRFRAAAKPWRKRAVS
jgi:hypothetical protein